MSTCGSCGQEVPERINPFNLIELRQAAYDSDIEWQNLDKGDAVELKGLLPHIVTEVVEVSAESEWDSYGYPTGRALVIFKVTNTVTDTVKTYRIEGAQSSYGGWDWDQGYISEVQPVTQTVTLWKSV